MTASIGVVVAPDDDRSEAQLVRMDGEAMYRAMEQGRNQVVLSSRKAAAR